MNRALKIVSAFASLLLLTGISVAQAEVTEIFDPYNIFGLGPIGQFLPGGEISCPGNLPTGDPLQPCPDGSRIKVRGVSYLMRMISTDPRFTGWVTVVANANVNTDGTGPEWGTASKVLDNGLGTWEGTAEGFRSLVPEGSALPAGCLGRRPCWVEHLKSVLHGIEGSVEGLQAMGTTEYFTFTLFPFARHGVASGVIVPPKH